MFRVSSKNNRWVARILKIVRVVVLFQLIFQKVIFRFDGFRLQIPVITKRLVGGAHVAAKRAVISAEFFGSDLFAK